MPDPQSTAIPSSSDAKVAATTASPAPQAGGLEQAISNQSQPGGIPQGLEKFTGIDGRLDVSKVGSSYLESEKALRAAQQEAANLRQALAASVATREPAPARTVESTTQAPSTQEVLSQFVQQPKEFITQVVNELGAPLAYEIQKTTLLSMHPELKDSNYAGEVEKWVENLPPDIRAASSTVTGADYLMKLYKRERELSAASRASSVPNAPSSEAPSTGRSGGGRTFTRQQIRNLHQNNPAEYARLEDEISAAYREGRVLD